MAKNPKTELKGDDYLNSTKSAFYWISFGFTI